MGRRLWNAGEAVACRGFAALQGGAKAPHSEALRARLQTGDFSCTWVCSGVIGRVMTHIPGIAAEAILSVGGGAQLISIHSPEAG